MSSKTLVLAALGASVVALTAFILYHTQPARDTEEDEDEDGEDEEQEQLAQETVPGDNTKDDDSKRLIVIDTNMKPNKKKSRKQKRSRMKAGFLNSLGTDGIDSPNSGKRKARVPKPAASSPVAVEDEIISQFVSVSKQMQELSAMQGTAAASSNQQVNALQRRRMSLVASLKGVRGQVSLSRLESRLKEISPPPPPPEPAELYRQSIAHRIMTDPDFCH